MEINAILDKHGLVKSGLWYVLSPENEGPSARVGHTCCVLKTSSNISKDCAVDNQNSENLLIIGGANPDGAFDDAYVLDFGMINLFYFDQKIRLSQMNVYIVYTHSIYRGGLHSMNCVGSQMYYHLCSCLQDAVSEHMFSVSKCMFVYTV